MRIEAFKKKVVKGPSDNVKYIAHTILEGYGYDPNDEDFCIGEGDISLSLDDMDMNKYAPHLKGDEEPKDLWDYIRRVTNVVPGCVFEYDPDAMENDPRWDD